MDKKIYNMALERSEGLCEICGGNYMVQCHHIFGGSGKRQKYEALETVIFLCWEHHYGKFGSHGSDGSEFNLKLRRMVQQTYMRDGYTEAQVRKMTGGKIY